MELGKEYFGPFWKFITNEEITDVDVVIPPLRLCGDNAGMIALAAAIECNQKHFAELDLNAKPSLAFAGFEE